MAITRSEKIVYDILSQNDKIKSIYSANIYTGYVAPNTISSVQRFILIHRVSGNTLDQTLSDRGDLVRLVRLQIDVNGKNYSDVVRGSDLIRDIMEENFPSSTEGDTFGTNQIGATTWNVMSIDFMVEEHNINK